ncbi:hypothetical protein RB653_001875 [Dictyostelium firmibasis]|uniref:Uncharacterized protein n=1 Tax=Dictyostelium firmibasis TaxID=79012 RepID=A0AAN7TWR9_9MYCE
MLIRKISLILIISLLFSFVLSDDIKINNDKVFNDASDVKSFVIEKVIGQIQDYANKYNLNQNQFISVITYACSYRPERCSIYNDQLPETLLSTAKVILQSKSDEIVKLIQDNVKSNDFKFSSDTNKKLERLLISLNLLGGLIGGTSGTNAPISAQINTQNVPDNRQNAPIAQNFQQYQQNQPISNPSTEDREAQLAAQRQMERDYREAQHRREMEEKARLAALALQQQLEREQNDNQQEQEELVPILDELPTPPPVKTPKPTQTNPPVKTKPPKTEQPKTEQPQTRKPIPPPTPTPTKPPKTEAPTKPPKSQQSSPDYSSYFDQFLDIVDLFTQKYYKEHENQSPQQPQINQNNNDFNFENFNNNNNNNNDNIQDENEFNFENENKQLSQVSPALSK